MQMVDQYYNNFNNLDTLICFWWMWRQTMTSVRTYIQTTFIQQLVWRKLHETVGHKDNLDMLY